jgi:hypothetical protein
MLLPSKNPMLVHEVRTRSSIRNCVHVFTHTWSRTHCTHPTSHPTRQNAVY